jgi:hypothetical protein
MDLIFPAIPKERIVFKAIRVGIGIREEKVARIIQFFLGKTESEFGFWPCQYPFVSLLLKTFSLVVSPMKMALDRCG